MNWNPSYSIMGLILLILEIIAIIEIIQSNRPVVEKLPWILFILIAPLLGLIVYYFFGRKGAMKV